NVEPLNIEGRSLSGALEWVVVWEGAGGVFEPSQRNNIGKYGRFLMFDPSQRRNKPVTRGVTNWHRSPFFTIDASIHPTWSWAASAAACGHIWRRFGSAAPGDFLTNEGGYRLGCRADSTVCPISIPQLSQRRYSTRGSAGRRNRRHV